MHSLCTCSKLRQLARKVTAIYDHYLASQEVSIGQYALLAKIARIGPIGVIPLAQLLDMDRSTLSRNLKPLIAIGWIATVDLPLAELLSKRSFGVILTAAGESKRAACEPRWHAAQAHIIALMGETQHLQLAEVMGSANSQLDAFTGILHE